MKIVIGIPAFNEEKNIASIILKLKKSYPEIIVCDDGSSDMTGNIAKEMGVHVITHKKNQGYGAAISSIFRKASEINSDILVTFDADGQHRVEDIQKVIEPLVNNEADFAIGSRFLNEPENVPKYRKIGIKAITKITNSVSGGNITDSQSGFRAYNKKILNSIQITESGMGVSTEILIKIQKANFAIKEIPIIVLYEGDTSTHNPISHGSSVVLSTIKYIAIERPLVFYGIPGIIFLAIGLLFGAWTIQIFSNEGEVITNIALVGIGGVILGTVLIITATILYSISSLIKSNKRND